MNTCDLELIWKQGLLLNDLSSLDLDTVAITDTRISQTQTLNLTFGDYKTYPSCDLIGLGSRVVVLFWKELNLVMQAIFLDPTGKFWWC